MKKENIAEFEVYKDNFFEILKCNYYEHSWNNHIIENIIW
jgi:hypothetical protein